MELIVQAQITCPHCGETFPLSIDTSLPEQTLVEDCTVCCRPINIALYCRSGEVLDVTTAI